MSANPRLAMPNASWAGLRFKDPALEQSYRHWRIERTMHIARLGGVVSILSWVAVAFFVMLFSQNLGITETLNQALTTQGAVVLVITLTVLSSYTRLIRIGPELIAATFIFTGLTAVVVLTKFIPSIGGAATLSISLASFAIFMRLPPLHSAISIAPFMGAAAFRVIDAHSANLMLITDLFWYLGSIGTMFFFVCVISVVSERYTRRSFENERLIEAQQKLIRRYVPPAVAEQITTGQEEAIERPQRRRVTVLFCDIAGFTDIADKVEPEVMTEVLNDYLSAMVSIIEEHNGTLNEFAGDGVMGLFGAPETMPPEDQAQQALKAAIAMHKALVGLNQQWKKLGLGTVLKARIGINTGMVSVGSYGSDGRMTYTAIGLQTNIAARIESKAEPGEVFISDATYQLLDGKIDCEPRGEVECKGVHFPVKVFCPKC